MQQKQSKHWRRKNCRENFYKCYSITIAFSGGFFLRGISADKGRLSTQKSTCSKSKMALNGQPSAIVNEILNNVSVLSNVLNNSQNIASSATSDSVEEEVRRIFRPRSVRDKV